MVRTLILLPLLALALSACNKAETPTDEKAPAEKPAAEKAPAPAEKAPAKPETPAAESMKPGDDRPMMLGCSDCRARVEAGVIKLDTAKIDGKGATLTGAKLDLSASGQTIKLPVPQAGIGKADLAIADSLDGLPSTKQCDKWAGAKATLEVDYTTASGSKDRVQMAMPIEVQGCP